MKNIPKKYPLSHGGEVCFLNSNLVCNELKKLSFKKTNVEKTTRTYNSQKHKIEYLIITSKK